jgi:hypothetical protein
LPKADIYLTGSDQVWNFKWNEGFDYHYFFKGIKGDKVALSSSIGQQSLTPEEQEILKRELKEYKKISVREAQAVKLLSEIGINSCQLIDPTLMLDKEDWKKYVKPLKYSFKYLLVYLPYNIVDKNKIFSFAKNIAKKKGLKVVTFSWWSFSKEKDADITIFNASPGDFLSLMYHSEYVVTNSFHGTAFSINLNKQFSVYEPSMFSSRILSLLSLVNLQDRLVNEKKELDDEVSIDYTLVNQILIKERERVFEFINNL